MDKPTITETQLTLMDMAKKQAHLIQGLKGERLLDAHEVYMDMIDLIHKIN